MDAIRSVSLGIMDYICNITLHIILMELLRKLKEEKNLKEHLFSDKGELNPVKTNSPPLKTWSCISIFPWYVHIFFSSSSVAICLDCFPVALRVFPVNPAPLPLPQWCPTSAEPCAWQLRSASVAQPLWRSGSHSLSPSLKQGSNAPGWKAEQRGFQGRKNTEVLISLWCSPITHLQCI